MFDALTEYGLGHGDIIRNDYIEESVANSQYRHYYGENYQKRKIKCRKSDNISADIFRIAARIFSECDKACKRGNQCADTADIYSDKQFAVVFGELRKQNR